MNDITKVSTFESIVKEFKVDSQGKGFVSRRGLARLCGKHHSTIQHLLESIKNSSGVCTSSRSLESLAGQSFEGGGWLSDYVTSAIIQHYAFSGSEKAQEALMLFSAIGLRTTIQNLLGWKPDPVRQLTPQEFVELCCLPFATPWQKRFSDEYYSHLSRLTKLPTTDNRKPALFGALTKRYIYDYLPVGVYDRVRQCKTETGNYKKLHQFLSENGLATLENQMGRVLGLMQGAATLEQFEVALRQSCTGQYQLGLLPSTPKVKEFGTAYKITA